MIEEEDVQTYCRIVEWVFGDGCEPKVSAIRVDGREAVAAVVFTPMPPMPPTHTSAKRAILVEDIKEAIRSKFALQEVRTYKIDDIWIPCA